MQEKWVRIPEVLLPTVPGSWKERYTANADFLDFHGTYFMYYRGTDQEHDRVGVMTCVPEAFDGITWEDYPGNPIIDVGAPDAFDGQNILDPSAVVFNDQVYLYYSGIGANGGGIGLAISQDGYTFKKYPVPVISGRCPEVVEKDGQLHLFFVRQATDHGYDIYHAVSSDGIHFVETPEPVLGIGPAGSWESYSVTTPRIFLDRGLYYLVYAADDIELDDSWRFGLAVSKDLLHWRKYEGNPIFTKGDGDAWDNSNIWFGTVEHINGRYWMWYEGCNHRRGYPDFISVVGTAYLDAQYFFIDPEK